MPLLGTRRTAVTGVRVPRQRELSQNLLPDAGVELEAFEDDADWTAGGNGTVADETTLYKTGSQAVRLTASDAGQSNMTKTVNWDLSSYKGFRIWVYTITTRPAGITIYLSSTSGFTKYMESYTSLTAMDGWQLVQIPLSSWTATGGATWTDTVIRIRVRIDPSAACYVVFDEFRGYRAATGALVLTFDDGYTSSYTEMFSWARQYGVRGTIYIIADYIGDTGYMDAEQLADLYAHGWDIGNHTDNHVHLDTLTEAQQEAELGDAKAILDGLGLTRASGHVAYPYGDYNADTLTAMAATGMVTGRLTTEAINYLPLADAYRIPAILVQSATTLATVKNYIRLAMDYGRVYLLYLHGITANPAASEWSIRDWRALCDFIASAGIPTLTISELYALQSAATTVTIAY